MTYGERVTLALRSFNGKSDRLAGQLLISDFLLTNSVLLLLWFVNVPLGQGVFSKEGYVENLSESAFSSYAQ